MSQIIDFMQKWGSLILATISAIVALISLIKSSKAQKIQTKLNENEILIKEYQLSQIEEEKKACVEARVVNISSGHYKLKIWNSGNATAKNITIEVEEGAPMIVWNDVFPFEELEPGKSLEVQLISHFEAKRKFYVITKWIDIYDNPESKKQWVSY